MNTMPEPWKSWADSANLNSYRKIAEAADLATGTVHYAILGKRSTVSPDTITGLAKALRKTEAEISQALGVGKLEGGVTPYVPPEEAKLLTARERNLIDETIRVLVLARQQSGDWREQEAIIEDQMSQAYEDAQQEAHEAGFDTVEDYNDATADPVAKYDEITQAKLAQALQSDYTPAASPHTQPDPHDGVGEENQDNREDGNA